MTHNPKKNPFPVCLVGSGPGDPGLITVRGLERLRQADVVVYDALADPRLLDEARSDAVLIDAGKRAREHRLTQDQTNALLVEHAQAGRRVVRLKGGDPYLFGRGAEEASYLARHGVACEVVPGVTSGIAAPMMAGIPVTHRQIASSVTFVTGHEDPAREGTHLDWSALTRVVLAGGTLCVYMGVGRLEAIARTMMEAGAPPTLPAAVVQWGAGPRQRQCRSTLGEVAQAVERAGLGAPAMVVIGDVAGIDEPGLDFFYNRPLFGRRILVTRTRQQASELRQQLEALGAWVLEAPTLRIVPPPSWNDVDATLARLNEFDWLVLTSANAVQALRDRLDALGLDSRALAGVKLAVIGSATQTALRDSLGLRADLAPDRFVAEALAQTLIDQGEVDGKRFLLLRADIARPALPEMLTEAGGEVTECVAYQTLPAESLPEPVLDALDAGEIDWIAFTSASTANNLADLLGDRRDLIAKLKVASIGPITSQAVRDQGWPVTLEADRSDVAGLVEALTQAEAQP